MYGYKVKMDGLPTTLWACEVSMTEYFWRNQSRSTTIEISLSTAESRTLTVNGRTYRYGPKPLLSCMVGDEPRESFCEPGVTITIASVAAELPALTVEAGELSEADCADESVILLPAVFCDLSAEALSELQRMLSAYIRLHASSAMQDRLRCYGLWFELLAKVDELTRQALRPGAGKPFNYYIKKIDYILETRYAEKLTEATVAAELNLSPGYLSVMYKREMGITFSTRLLQVRMNRAQELLLDPNLPTAKVAQAVGFADEGHFRKRFRQYFGMSVREYRHIKQGVTLYHAKPTRKEY